jgi:hypothetical protein
MLIGNHYFSPDTKTEIIIQYFHHLEMSLDTQNSRVILLGDFNAPGFNWDKGTPLSTCNYYSKLKGEAIFTSTCLLDLRQCVEATDSRNMLDLVFANFAAIQAVPATSGLVTPDAYHPPLLIDVILPYKKNNLNCWSRHYIYAAGDYSLLYNLLCTYDWSNVYEAVSVDAAVTSLNAAVLGAMELAIPRGYGGKSKFPPWFSSALRYYISKKNYFHRRVKRNPSDYYQDRFAFYRKLVKSTIKSDRLRWLKSIDNDLKAHPRHFWKYVSNFRKHRPGSFQLNVAGTHVVDPTAVAEAFSQHFQSVYSSCIPMDTPPISNSSDFLSLAPVSDADVCKAIKRLKPSKSVGIDDVPGFIIKGCMAIFIPILRHIFNLSLTQQYFPAAWKEAAVVPVFKKGNRASVSNYRPISVLNNFAKLFEFIIHDHVSHFAKFNPNQHGFTRTKSTVTNLVTFLDLLTPVVRGQRQADAVYFDLSNAFDLVPHDMLLCKLSSFGFSDAYVNWFRSYLTNRQSRVRVSGYFSQPFQVTSGVPQGSVLGPFLFNLFINDLCNSITYSKVLLFADDFKILRVINSPHDCHLLQHDINSISDWCSANSMRLNIVKTRVMTYTRKTNFLSHEYKLCHAAITRTSFIKDLGVYFDSKLHFHDHVDSIFSECIKLLGLIRSMTYGFSSLECLCTLYITLVRSRLEYASVVWNSITSTDANKLERIQQKFASVCVYRFFSNVSYAYNAALDKLGLQSLRTRRHYLDALFFVQVYRGLKSCPSLLESVSLRVPSSNLREFSLFGACPSNKHCPSARCAYAANVVGKDLDLFATGAASLSDFLPR